MCSIEVLYRVISVKGYKIQALRIYVLKGLNIIGISSHNVNDYRDSYMGYEK